jgi:hypothetical protein
MVRNGLPQAHKAPRFVQHKLVAVRRLAASIHHHEIAGTPGRKQRVIPVPKA